MRRTLVLLVALSALAATAAAGQGSPAVTLSLSKDLAVYGDAITATGMVEEAQAGEAVVVELVEGETVSVVARAVTDAIGGFAVELPAARSGAFRARAEASGLESDPAVFTVLPDVRVGPARGRAFVGGTLTARIRPASYAGRVSIVVRSGRRVVATTSADAQNGRLRAAIPTPALGKLTVILTVAAGDGLASRTVRTTLRTRARTLTPGTSGADVRALARRLAQLRFRVPGFAPTYSWELYDSVVAFQKAYGLPRTGVVGPQTWRMLGRAQVLEPRSAAPGDHIEVDKTRQILLDVRGGEVAAVLPVSTGATNNTPEGRHVIRWKAPATTTWLGEGILYRTLTFVGNSFAIHGWVDVPPYPASHGCVRIPIWTADWLYNRSPVGRAVHVYA